MKRKREKNDAALLKRYETSVTSRKPARQPKETKKTPDKKNPRDVSVDPVAVDAFGLSGKNRDRAVSLQLLPERSAQTAATLDLRGDETPPAEDSSLYRDLVQVNIDLHRRRNNGPASLQDLVRLGLLSPIAVPQGVKRVHACQQLEQDTAFMRSQLRQLTTSDQQQQQQPSNTMVVGRSVTRKGALSQNGRAAQVKLSLLFGPINYAYGYEKRASYDHREFVGREWDRERAERQHAFFCGDPLADDEGGEWRGEPLRFKLFRQLTEACRTRYEQRHTALRDTNRLVPRPELETVNRAQITEARTRPKKGEQLCFNGTRCVGHGIGSDQSLWYTMRAFYTKKQRENGHYDPMALCVDCYFSKWTVQCTDNISHEREVSLPFNHFGVRVGPGEYNERVMLPVVFNRLETGVAGYVPTYHQEYRHMKMSVSQSAERTVECEQTGRKRRKVDTESESYIVESSVLDF